jgi:hypothetical protein
LKKFFFEFNQGVSENPLEKEHLEDLWVQQTEFIQYNIDEKIALSLNKTTIKGDDKLNG